MLKKLLSLFKPKYRSISLSEAKPGIDNGTYFILDVRSKGECASGVIKGAKNIPFDQLFDRIGELEKYKNHPVLVSCLSGVRSASACVILADNGFTDVSNLTGGMVAWRSAGYKLS